MALLTATRPTAAGVAWSPAAVSASDTISAADLGQLGAYLVIINAGVGADSVTVSDAGATPAGNAATTVANSVANGASEVMYISPRAVNPATGVVTVAHTQPTGVNCVLLPIG